MALHHVAIVAAVLVALLAAPAWSHTHSGGLPDEACLSTAESRDLFVADKLMPPFRVMRETAKAGQAEAIDIELCRSQGTLVYDVTLLDQQGRLFHRLVNATSGAAVASPPPRPPGEAAPRPAPRPGPEVYADPYPEGGPNAFPGRRLGPNFFPGQRLGPNFYPGYRVGPPFFPGGRPGGRGPGSME